MVNVTLHPPGTALPPPQPAPPPAPDPAAPVPTAAQPLQAAPPRPAPVPGLAHIEDALGRRLGVRKVGPLERMRIFKACGPENSRIEQYVGTATLAYAVAEIDGEPVSPPSTERQIEALVMRLGDEGLDAVGRLMLRQQGITEADIEAAGGDVAAAARIAAERRQREVVAAARNFPESQS